MSEEKNRKKMKRNKIIFLIVGGILLTMVSFYYLLGFLVSQTVSKTSVDGVKKGREAAEKTKF